MSEILDFADHLTQERNEKYFKTLADRIDHLILIGREMVDTVRAEDNKILPVVSAKAALRIFTVLQGLAGNNAIVQKLMEKFPETGCSYCGKKPCQCAVDRPKGHANISSTEAQKSWSISDWQRHLAEVYPGNIEKGLLWISNRLTSEIAEVLQARMLMDMQPYKEDQEEYRQEAISELADSFAWAIAVCNATETNLEQAFVERYGKGCPNCEQNPCKCGPFTFIQERKIKKQIADSPR
jgi:NTP pyrophosphatase (non-canonical NTP hydrolase)